MTTAQTWACIQGAKLGLELSLSKKIVGFNCILWIEFFIFFPLCNNGCLMIRFLMFFNSTSDNTVGFIPLTFPGFGLKRPKNWQVLLCKVIWVSKPYNTPVWESVQFLSAADEAWEHENKSFHKMLSRLEVANTHCSNQPLSCLCCSGTEQKNYHLLQGFQLELYSGIDAAFHVGQYIFSLFFLIQVHCSVCVYPIAKM